MFFWLYFVLTFVHCLKKKKSGLYEQIYQLVSMFKSYFPARKQI